MNSNSLTVWSFYHRLMDWPDDRFWIKSQSIHTLLFYLAEPNQITAKQIDHQTIIHPKYNFSFYSSQIWRFYLFIIIMMLRKANMSSLICYGLNEIVTHILEFMYLVTISLYMILKTPFVIVFCMIKSESATNYDKYSNEQF